MSVIKCPECGQEVSTKADVCPHCGVAIKGNLKRCPKCNTIMLKEEEECPQCHAHFVAEKAETTAPTPADRPQELQKLQEPVHDEVAATAAAPAESAVQQASADTTATPAAPPKKSIGGWVLTALIVVLAALIALMVWQHIEGREADAEQAYVILKDCNDSQSFQDFINRYPKSRHIAEVQARLKELREEDTAWKAASITTQVELIRTFIENYPTSAHRATAFHRIDTLDWRTADNAGTSASYTSYINAHEAGDFITEAYTAREEALRRELRARNDSIAAARADSLKIIGPGIDNVFAE